MTRWDAIDPAPPALLDALHTLGLSRIESELAYLVALGWTYRAIADYQGAAVLTVTNRAHRAAVRLAGTPLTDAPRQVIATAVFRVRAA